ncbi:MAG TPA: hypothetical protein VFQ14_04300 [Thermoleophilaceae bacterium]|nr:hypothetical protein [Thermoleophilaceae bacterium]
METRTLSLDEFKVLRAVVFAGALTDLDELWGLDADRAQPLVERLAADGLIEADELTIPTIDGVGALEDWYAGERASLAAEQRRALHERFRPLDAEIKRIAAAWQDCETRDDWEGRTAAVEDLQALDVQLAALVGDYSDTLPRLGEYRERLATALARVADGDLDYLVGVSCDSYHTVWFQLHEDVLRILDEERDPE